MAFSLGEYGDIFLEEADEQLQELNQNLIELEKNPENEDIINNIFRAAHSLKSSAAFVGLNDLSDLAHKMENLLQGIRDKTMEINPEIVNVIFKCFDEITSVIDTVAGGEAPTQDLSGIISEIQKIAAKYSGSAAKPVKPGTAPAAAPTSSVDTAAANDIPKLQILGSHVAEIKDALNGGKLCYEIAVYIDTTAQMRWVKAQLVLNNLEGMGDVLITAPGPEDIPDSAEVTGFRVLVLSDLSPRDLKKACDIDQIDKIEIRALNIDQREGKTVLSFDKVDEKPDDSSFVVEEKTTPSSAVHAPEVSAPASIAQEHDSESFDDDEISANHGSQQDGERRKGHSLKTVKVSIDKLDQLLNNVGELVVANSGFYKLYDEVKVNPEAKAFASEFKNRIEQMARIAKDLQNGIMNTRMVPIGQVFSRFNRLVRDLTREFNKDVILKISGEETELDKKVIDVIGEPLLHLIRNAIDHGVELPEDRKAAGKNPQATVHLNAYQGGNQIFVEVSDDGKGLDLNVIKRKALEKGIVTVDQLDNMDDSEIYAFIFAAGFSTAQKITDISGRGVGMNVVKQTVEELNGNVSIDTELGSGTKFVMAFPLTLAIIPAIMVRIRRELYAIPLSDVLDTIKIQPSDITTIEGHEVINFRGEILSVVRLNRFIGLKTSLRDDQKIPVVVVSFGNRKIGLIVDQLEGKQEIVIKSLEQNYTTVHGLAGASILGDGSICLILDITSMINKLINDQERYEVDDDSYVDIDYEDYENGFGGLQQEKDGEKTAIGMFKVEAKKEDNDIKAKNTDPQIVPGVSVPSADYMTSLDRKESTMLFDRPENPVEKNSSVLFFDEMPAEPAGSASTAGSIERDHRETTPVSEAAGQDVDSKVRDALRDFKNELKQNIEMTIENGGPNAHMHNSLNVSREELKEFQLLANTGAANAAESMSRILSKRIDLAIPEVSIKPVESIPQFIGDLGGQYVGILLSILGDVRGSLFLVFSEQASMDLINILYHAENSKIDELDEDKISAIKEIGNIVGSSVLNVFAEKTGLFIHPSIPTFVRDYLTAIFDSILIMHNVSNDYAIVMDTAFFFEDDRVVGSLMIMPEAESLKQIVESLRAHVPAN